MEPQIHHWAHIEGAGVETGDLVSAEAGGLPIYRVLACQDRRLWLREERSGRDHVLPVDAMHWKLAN